MLLLIGAALVRPAIAQGKISGIALDRMNSLAGEKMVFVVTDHFELFYSIPKLRIGRKNLSKEGAAAVYAKRLETIYDEVSKILQPRPGVVQHQRHRIILTHTRKAFDKVARKFTGHSGGAATYQYWQHSMFATFLERNPEIKNDSQLHRKVTHIVAHLIIQNFGTMNREFPAWANAGFAHWLERKLFGSKLFGLTPYFCYSEVPHEDDWRKSSWTEKIRKEVTRGKHASLGDLAGKPLDALTRREMAYATSYVDFLIANDREKFESLIRELKRSPDTRTGIRKTYDWLLGDLEQEWLMHVAKPSRN